jgi:Fur family transcriptional regulator, ferric uptake regulator
MERKTRQRDAIRGVFLRVGRPLSPTEVLQYAQVEVPGLGIATVYRNIKSLVEEGELKPIDIPGQSTCYESAGLAHHHHFHCNRCGKVYDIEGCPGKIEDLTPKGFSVESHEVILFGSCDHCNLVVAH